MPASLQAVYDAHVDPYRAPQSLPGPPPDAMRIILMIAGGVAGLIAVVAIGVYVFERRDHKSASPPSVAKVPPPVIAAQAQPDRPPHPWGIAQGIVLDSDDFSFAIFPASQNKRAITIFKTEHGRHAVELLAGRSYDVCWGGDASTTCTLETNGHAQRVESCDPRMPECTCKSGSGVRYFWRAGCERVRVDSVTHVTVNVKAQPRFGFDCDPADACVKTDVNPDDGWR